MHTQRKLTIDVVLATYGNASVRVKKGNAKLYGRNNWLKNNAK